MLAKLVLCAALCVASSQVSLASQDISDVFQTNNVVQPRLSETCNHHISQIKKGVRNIIILAVEALGLPVVFGGVNLVCMVTTRKLKECTGHFFVALWHLAQYLLKWAAVIVGTMAYSVYGAASNCFADSFLQFNALLLR